MPGVTKARTGKKTVMSPTAMVFAPAPLVTVAIEQPADEVELHVHPGGQGVWQARMITALDVSVTLCAYAGGEIGRVLERLIADEGVTLRVVRGGTSTGWYVHDRRDGERVEIAEHPGQPLTRHDIDELYGMALAEGLRADICVLSGPTEPSVVPPDIYRRLAADLTNNGARVVADLSGDHLTAVCEGGLYFLKVSHEQLIDDGRAENDSDDEIAAAIHTLHGEGAECVVVTRAESSSLALLDGGMYEVIAPTLEAADTRGAGDSLTAGVTAVLAKGGDLTDAVRTGAAAGAINVTRHGLGEGRADAIAELIPRVGIEPLKREG
jgi:1-phosphofructokinase